MHAKMLVKSTPGVYFINVLWAAFACPDPESAKKTDNLTVFFVLSGSAHIIAACRMLMKLTPEVDFFNIRSRLFRENRMKCFFSVPKIGQMVNRVSKNVCQIKLEIFCFNCWWNWTEIFLECWRLLLVEKSLVNCTPVVNFINILRACFLYGSTFLAPKYRRLLLGEKSLVKSTPKASLLLSRQTWMR